MAKKNILIMGAAGRDFHNFLTHYKDNSEFDVKAFTATQIPGIDGRKFPGKLAGKLYPRGIPIFPEQQLDRLIRRLKIDEVVFSYSDISHENVMHKASQVLAAGANFTFLGPDSTMLKSKKKVIAVCAVRTGSGKSQTTRRLAQVLSKHGKKVAIIRHPMPYGDLVKQESEVFENLEDLMKYDTTIEEREEYEEPVREGFLVLAGVNYAKILKEAEKRADIVIFDGGNNDFSFIHADLYIVVADPLRAMHGIQYHPGEANFRMADVIVINKENSAKENQIHQVVKLIHDNNPGAEIIHADSILTAKNTKMIIGKKVLVIEDGPTVTHGGMSYGAGYLMAKKFNCHIVDPRKHAVGSIRDTFKKYPHLEKVLPAMGYSTKQVKELEDTINRTDCEFVVSGTPIDLGLILKVKKPVIHVRYALKEKGKTLEKVLKEHKLI